VEDGTYINPNETWQRFQKTLALRVMLFLNQCDDVLNNEHFDAQFTVALSGLLAWDQLYFSRILFESSFF
jgi:hypothetical protein